MESEEFKSLKRRFRRKRQKQDQEIIDQILIDLKKIHEEEKEQKITQLKKQLKEKVKWINL
jgi:hypothetical protein